MSLGSFEQPEPKYTLYQHIPFFLPVIKSLRRNRIVRICSLSFGPYVLVKMFQIKCVSVEFVSIVYSDILQSLLYIGKGLSVSKTIYIYFWRSLVDPISYEEVHESFKFLELSVICLESSFRCWWTLKYNDYT